MHGWAVFNTLRMVHTECTSTHHYVRYSKQITRHRKLINLFLSLTLGHLNRFSTFPVYVFLCTKAMQKLLPITMKSYLMGMWLAYSIYIKHRGHFVQIFNMDSYSYGLNIVENIKHLVFTKYGQYVRELAHSLCDDRVDILLLHLIIIIKSKAWDHIAIA